MKLGFIGCGNMATAIINGIINKNIFSSGDINAYDVSMTALEKISNAVGVTICKSEIEIYNNSDIVFLAVKPNIIGDVMNKISTGNADKLIISIAAGKTIEFLEGNMVNKHKLVRVMPNINAKVGEAISAYCPNELVNDKDIEQVELLLSSFGECIRLDEAHFPIFGVIGGCSPAFAYMFIDALARAAVKNGMKKDEALKISAQAVYGSAKMILECDEHPWKLVDNVCSPGGTTIEGVTSLQQDGFESAIHNAVDKAFNKDKLL